MNIKHWDCLFGIDNCNSHCILQLDIVIADLISGDIDVNVFTLIKI